MTPEQKETLSKLQRAALESADLRSDSRINTLDLDGFCYILAEAMWYAHRGELQPYRMLCENGASHWYLFSHKFGVVECTQEDGAPFADFLYNGRRSSFLSFPNPSNRTKKLAERAGVRLEVWQAKLVIFKKEYSP